MRAAVVDGIGARWNIRDISRPEPKAGEVLIKIHASGICYTDVHLTQGTIGAGQLRFPSVLGHEPAGEIVEIGDGVKSRRVGDRVGVAWHQSSCGRCEWCLRGKGLFCMEQVVTGMQRNGSHAEFMIANADATMLLPAGISYEQAAPIFCAGFTVWSGLRFAFPKPHERIAVVGIGGLGHLAIQYSKAAGFETIAVTRSGDKESTIRELGADEVVADGEGLRNAGGADVILATSNSYKAMMDSVKGLRPDGRLMWMGISGEAMQVPQELFYKRGRIIASTQNSREHLYEALDYVAKGKVKALVETYTFDQIGKAYDRVVNGKVRYRAVITD